MNMQGGHLTEPTFMDRPYSAIDFQEPQDRHLRTLNRPISKIQMIKQPILAQSKLDIGSSSMKTLPTKKPKLPTKPQKVN